MKNNSSSSVLIASLCILGLLILMGVIADTMTPKCSQAGCDLDRASGSVYCYLHKPYSGNTSTKKRSTSSSSSSSKSSGSSTTKSSGSTSGSSKSGSSSTSSSSKKSSSKSRKSNIGSYDEGYEAIYEDDDYDWDRYQTDSDYANGVDDAMDELDW